MDTVEELKKLMEHLEKTESEKQHAAEELKRIIADSLDNIKDIYFSMKRYVWKNDISLRSYDGKTFNIGEGVLISDRGIEEKIVLKPDRRILLYKLDNGEVTETELTADNIEEYISIDNIFSNVMEALTSSIQRNEKDVLRYTSMIAKIERYTQDLKNIMTAKNDIN